MMSWAEFVIRSTCFREKELDQWRKIRFIAYVALQAPHVNPKRIPKSIEKFLPLGDKKQSELTDERLKMMQEAWKTYQENKSGKS